MKTRIILSALASLALGALAACDDGGDDGTDGDDDGTGADAAPSADAAVPFVPGFDPPPPGPDEVQLVSPPVYGIEPGADVTLCHYIDTVFTEEMDIVQYQGYQSILGGHHALLYAVVNPKPAGTAPCTEEDMFNVRFLAAAGADTPAAELPPNVVFRIPAGKQLMIQTHWINSTDDPLDGQAAFTLKLSPPKPEHLTATIFTIADTSFTVPVGAGSTSVACTVERDMKIFQYGGHMHEWGDHVSITYTPVGGQPQMIYDTGWEHEDVNNPPMNFHTDTPFEVKAGDRFQVDCSYLNDTGGPLPFPSEMCVMFAFFYPGSSEINCTDGNWPGP